MTSTYPESRLVDRAVAARLVPARLDHALGSNPLLAGGRVDPRIVDPSLAAIVEDARATAAAEGRAAGHAAGYAEGRERVEADLRERADRDRLRDEDALQGALDRIARIGQALERAATALENRCAPVYLEAADDLGPVVFDIVEAVLGRELLTDREPVLDAVRRAAEQAPRNAPLTLRLNPRDVDTLGSLGIDVAALAARPVDVVADDGVELGGALADSGARRIDAQLSTAMARVKEVLGA